MARKVKSFARLRQTCHLFSETQAMALCSPGIALGATPDMELRNVAVLLVQGPQDTFKYMLSKYFQTTEFAKTCHLQRLEFARSSSDDWQVLLSQLWAVVLRDLAAALLSKYVRDGKGHRFGYRYLQFERDGRAFSGQCFSSECTSGIHKQAQTNIPIIITKSNMYITLYNLHGLVFKPDLSN